MIDKIKSLFNLYFSFAKIGTFTIGGGLAMMPMMQAELIEKRKWITDEELIEMVEKTSVRFVIDSDAHSAGRVGDTKLVEEQLKRINFPMDRIDNIEGRLPNFRFAEFKKRL